MRRERKMNDFKIVSKLLVTPEEVSFLQELLTIHDKKEDVEPLLQKLKACLPAPSQDDANLTKEYIESNQGLATFVPLVRESTGVYSFKVLKE
jgi:hypothetical protein